MKTYSNDRHDFYRIRFISWEGQTQLVFNIVPKGSPKPTIGYYRPDFILKANGYEGFGRVSKYFKEIL